MPDPRCQGTDAHGRPCEANPLEGRAHCPRHDREHLAAIGRKGRAKQVAARRAERERIAAEFRLGDGAGILATLESICRAAFVEGQYSAAATAARAANDVHKTMDLEREVAEIRGLLAEGGASVQ